MVGISQGMTEVQAVMAAPASKVYAEMADGWAYVGWVVGANHIRDVDLGWPEPGSKIHHKIGAWPVEIADVTVAIECVPDRRLVLRARGWPLGEAIVELDLISESEDRTRILMREAPSAGPAAAIDNPALRWLLRRRNLESLRRLKDRVEHRRRPELDG
jgi:hypothetical protein